MKKSNYLIQLFAVFVFILFTGCEKDLYTDSVKQKHDELDFKWNQKSLEELKDDATFNKGYLPFKEIQKSKLKLGRTVMEDMYNFTIDSTKIHEVIAEDYTSYTFGVIRPYETLNYFENLFIEIVGNEEPRAVILRHDLDPVTRETINTSFTHIEFNDDEAKIAAPDVNCFTIMEIVITACGSGQHYGDEIGCVIGGGGWVLVPREYCLGGGGGGTGSSSSGGGSGSGSGSTSISVVHVMTPIELKRKDFQMNTLSPEQLTWLNTQPETDQAAVYNYLSNTGTLNNPEQAYSDEKKEFIKDCINQINQDPNDYIISIIPFLIEEQIDDDLLDPCSKNVFQQIKNTTNYDFSNVLAKLDANGSLYNISMKTEALPNGNTSPATTKRNSAFNYTIYISPDYNGKTKFFIASLMFHELVHAYFLSIVDDYRANPNNNQNLYNLNSFPSLFQAYCDKKYPPASGTAQNIHHLEMANYYVDAIARALQEYQTGTPVPTGANPEQIYTDLAWGGLNQTPVFEATYPVGNPDRQRILNRLTCEQNGTPISQGTSNQQNPIGLPCI